MTVNASVNTFGFSCQPDCTVMDANRIDQNMGLSSQLDSSLAEFFIEFKAAKDQDPFKSSSKKTSNLFPERPLMDLPLSPSSKVLGQITAYVTMLLGTQYRTHVFLILIVRDIARLLRWDRGGAVVSEAFDYNDHPHLFEFLVRYNRAGSDIRGHDETVSNTTDNERTEAQATVGELQGVKHLVTATIQQQHYVIRAPCARPDIPVGRWTQTSVAYHCETKERVFLKDSWRVSLPEITPEGEIYATLRQSLVPNVPNCLASGDIGDITYHSTRTHDFIKYTHDPDSKKIPSHRHHRLVLDTVGRELSRFTCSKDMVRAIHASLIGKYIISYRRITVF